MGKLAQIKALPLAALIALLALGLGCYQAMAVEGESEVEVESLDNFQPMPADPAAIDIGDNQITAQFPMDQSPDIQAEKTEPSAVAVPEKTPAKAAGTEAISIKGSADSRAGASAGDKQLGKIATASQHGGTDGLIPPQKQLEIKSKMEETARTLEASAKDLGADKDADIPAALAPGAPQKTRLQLAPGSRNAITAQAKEERAALLSILKTHYGDDITGLKVLKAVIQLSEETAQRSRKKNQEANRAYLRKFRLFRWLNPEPSGITKEEVKFHEVYRYFRSLLPESDQGPLTYEALNALKEVGLLRFPYFPHADDTIAATPLAKEILQDRAVEKMADSNAGRKKPLLAVLRTKYAGGVTGREALDLLIELGKKSQQKEISPDEFFVRFSAKHYGEYADTARLKGAYAALEALRQADFVTFSLMPKYRDVLSGTTALPIIAIASPWREQLTDPSAPR